MADWRLDDTDLAEQLRYDDRREVVPLPIFPASFPEEI